MDSKSLLQRIRQINAVDRNALDIYTDLMKRVGHPDLVNIFQQLVRDETRHVTLEKELISFLEDKS